MVVRPPEVPEVPMCGASELSIGIDNPRFSVGMAPTTDAPASSGALLAEARHRAGLTQSQFAQRAGVTRSVISAYESGARQPSMPMLQRLVAASGLQLAIDVRQPAPAISRLTGPLGTLVLRHRRAINALAATRGASNLRVFGSVARGEETEHGDIDLLVDLAPHTGQIGLSTLQRDLSTLLSATVDLVPTSDLKPDVARQVLIEAVPL